MLLFSKRFEQISGHCLKLFYTFQVDCGHSSNVPELLRDYCDGQQFCQHSLFSNDSSCLQLIIYYDELELCNPLGSRRKKHKIGLYIFSLQ